MITPEFWKALNSYLEEVRDKGLALDIDETLLDNFESLVKSSFIPF